MDCSGRVISKSFGRMTGGSEHYIVIEPPADLDLTEQLACLEQRYDETRQELGLPAGGSVFRRLFVSDAMNQAPLLRRSRLAEDEDGSPVALSIIQQPPLSGTKLSLLAYHVSGALDLSKRRLTPRHVVVEKNGLAHLWTTGLCPGSDDRLVPVTQQTRRMFDTLIDGLDGLGGTLHNNCVRTWIYVKGIDVFYKDMVTSRSEMFLEQGLSAETHFIASTGIEGACAHRFDIVTMDAYSILGLAPQQVSYLNDFDRLCPTRDYNVTFERGTRIAYADRAHLFISGTASIDRSGQVVHPGNVMRQFDHALDNVEALLRAGSAGLSELMHLIVYLRDPTDHPRIKTALSERLPGVPAIIVQGPVCRPEWLVEVEGIAIADNEDLTLPSF
ncbi:Endoribonuclease L-PSP (plasmid) [Acidiphilium cryptum JF-5]|uniref:Endoribonuclease L-PSP n=2 Tax=Acidiphilium cryptum TaxID=524 RepID=A5FTZ8_ACICJ|nr:Endoribonuclease L-PSP [Acidiphilium cryptum JF-5]UBU64032.1 hypothetical protein LDB30_15605 [Acidithiobacillus ferrooxidans]